MTHRSRRRSPMRTPFIFDDAVPDKPTRDQLACVNCALQGVTVTTQQLGTIPSWGPEVAMLTSLEDRQAVYAAHKAAGATHLTIGVTCHYQEGGVQYPNGIAADNNFLGNLPALTALVAEIVQAGLMVLLMHGADDQDQNQFDRVANGADEIVCALAEWQPWVVHCPGFDGVVPIGNENGANLQAMIQMVLAMREAVGEAGVIAFELPTGWSFWGPGPYAGAGSYTSLMGQAVDVWLQEFASPPGPPEPAPKIIGGTWDAEHNDYAPVWDKDATAWQQIWQIAARTVPHYTPPPDQPYDVPVRVTGGPNDGQVVPVSADSRSPQRYACDTPRGHSYWISFEVDAYGWTHGETTSANAQAAVAYIVRTGYDA